MNNHKISTTPIHLGHVMSRITAAADQVWRTRSKIGHLWPLPDQVDCLAFAVTEIAEVIRANLTAGGKYNLNNPRDHDQAAEMADTALMLISFLGEHYDYGLMQHRLHVGAPQRMLGMDEKQVITPQSLPALAALVGLGYHLASQAHSAEQMPYMMVEETLALVAAMLPSLHTYTSQRLDRVVRRIDRQQGRPNHSAKATDQR